MKRVKTLGCGLIIVLVAIHALVPKASAEDGLRTAIARGVSGSAPAELGQQAGIFKKYGIVLDLIYLDDPAKIKDGVASKAVDLGLPYDAMAAIRDYASGADIRIIGASMSGSSNYWYVLKSSPIQTIKDAAGKNVAYETNGSRSQYDAIDLLKFFRLKARLVATGSAGATLGQLKSGSVHIAWASPPFGAAEIANGDIRIVARANDVPKIRNKTTSVIITNAEAVQKRNDLLLRFIKAYREAIEWMYTDPAALKRYAELTGLPEAVARQLRDEFYPKNLLSPEKIVSLRAIVRDAVAERYLAKKLSRSQIRKLVQIPAPALNVCEPGTALCPLDFIAP